MTVSECAEHKWLSYDDDKPLLTLAPAVSPTSVMSSPLGSRRALSSSSDNSTLPEPNKRQCYVIEDDATTPTESRLSPPPIAAAAAADISVLECTVESSQHTTAPDHRPSTSNTSTLDPTVKSDGVARSPVHSSTLSFEIKDCHVVNTASPQQDHLSSSSINTSPVKSFTVTKEFTIDGSPSSSVISTRHKEISLTLDIRPSVDEASSSNTAAITIIEHSPLLVRRAAGDTKRQLVC